MNNAKKDTNTGLEVAVIGMAGKFPGAKNLNQYWDNLKNGVESVSFFSDKELLENGVSPELLKNPNYVKARGILEDIENFDASFFGYTPRDAEIMDPQARIFHECAYEALEHAGYAPESYNGLIGLYAGDSMNLRGIQKLLQEMDPEEQFQTLLFNDTSYLCTLVSYKLNLKGPSITVQTACSTSLVAIHLACQALLSGECDIALAGGVTVFAPQKVGYLYSDGMIFSPDGHCRTFDARAKGTYFSDGVGVVVLKSLEDALAAGDTIHAIIKGSAINNDGSGKIGFTAPGIEGQTMVLKTAYEVAGISPESISYIEAHGSGTDLGDPIEVEALKRAFNTTKKGFCKIGVVKTNFGHLYTAAGIAGFIKVVLSLKHRKIPPSLNFETPNPKIDFENSPFKVNTKLCEWENNGYPLRAGVSSFGVGGTNAHIVVEEASEPEPSPKKRPWEILVLSSKNKPSLERTTENLRGFLKEHPESNLANTAYTLQVGRGNFQHRRMVVCEDIPDAVEKLSHINHPDVKTVSIDLEKDSKIIFMLPDQGDQYVNMGLELYEKEPVFQKAIDQCFALLRPLINYDLKDVLYPVKEPKDEKIHQAHVAELSIFVLEYALANLLMQWGIKPQAMIGDGVGEYVAACISGVLSLKDALTLLAAQGKVRQQMLGLQDFEDKILSMSFNNPEIPYISNGTGQWVTQENILSPRYWIDHLLKPKGFSGDLPEQLREQDVVFVIIGPAGKRITDTVLGHTNKTSEQKIINLLRPPQEEVVSDLYYLLHNIGYLWALGIHVDWHEFHAGEHRHRIPLPTYPFEPQRFPIDKHIQHRISTEEEKPQAVLYKRDLYQRNESIDTYISARNEIEQAVVDIFQEILGIDQISTHEDFFDLGGDSLKALNIVRKIREKLQKDIPIKSIFDYPTVEMLAEYLNEESHVSSEPFYPIATPDMVHFYESFPLTEVQTAYLLGRDKEFDMGGISTHLYIELKTGLDIPRLSRAFQKVIARHPMLRAIILETGQQRFLEQVPQYEIQVLDLTMLSPALQQQRLIEERNKRSHRIFQPNQWPLFEIYAIKISENTHYLLIDFDMLITDAASLQIIATELMKYYDDPEVELPELEFSFRDYILTHREFRQSAIYTRDKEYWQNKLIDFPDAPSVPLKCNPTTIQEPCFKRHQKIFSQEVLAKLKRIARQHSITPSALLLTAYAEVMAHWSNQSDLAINLTVFNRLPFHDDVPDVVGDFTSIMILGIHLAPNSSFWDRAKEVQNVLLEAYEHRHYDGIDFIRELTKHKNLSRQVAIPIVFTSLLFEVEETTQNNISRLGEMVENLSQTPQVFIDHQAVELNNELILSWDYVDDLFEPEVIEGMFTQYITSVTNILEENEGERVKFPQKTQLLLEQYNATDEPITPMLLHSVFQKQAKATPEAIAVEFGDERITYKELNEKSNQVAHYLRQEYGIGKNDMVGVLTERSSNTIVYVMGILKAGAAYVPIDPEYPEDRRNYIYNNSKCKLLLIPDFYSTNNIASYPVNDVEIDSAPGDNAYVIYTSGSTGKPKGVIITHQAVTNTILDVNKKFGINATDKILGISSMCFDLSVYDLFGALSTGATLVLVKDQRDIRDLIHTIQTHNITVWNSVPAIMDQTVKLAEEIVANSKRVENSEDTQDIPNPVPSKATESVRYWWSPVIHWSKESNGIHIGDRTYTGVALQIFPKLYFLVQIGLTLDEIIHEFPEKDPEELRSFLQTLIQHKVLVSSILAPEDLFSSQTKLFKNTYSEDIIYVAEALEKFKKKQLTRTYPEYNETTTPLMLGKEFPAYLSQRRSYRNFDTRPIPFKVFSKFLSILRQTQKHDGNIRYYYASAGGLYPIDVFVYVKKGRIENMAEGLYYYNPMTNSLNLVNDTDQITKKAHYFLNRDIFEASAFSLFFVYNAEVTMPKYQGSGYFYACIDTGIMVGTLTQAAEHLGIGLCSIGNLNFQTIQDYFHLNENQVLIHTVEAGIKDDLGTVAFERIVTETEEAVPLFGGNKNSEINTSLRLVLLSGDWIPLTLPPKIKQYFPNTKVIGLGGATEASIWSIYYPIQEINKKWSSIPYGMPLANQKFYVLNHEMQFCPIGVEGELYIGGVGLASGYIHDEEKTRNAFITHPEFGTLYKTGDYGVFHKEGYIEFRGRKDQQVKMRGFRIELGEIEHQMLTHPDITEAVSTIRAEEQTGEKYLCVHYVMKSTQSEESKELTISELRVHLLKALPDYMIPTHFVRLPQMPLTTNGKIDIKALPAPQQQALSRSEVTYVAPATHTQKMIADIAKEVLHLEKVGVRDNFFDLGANSVHIIEFGNKLTERFQKAIPVSTYFRYSTIESLAEFLSPTETSTESVAQTEHQTERLRKAKDKIKKVVRKRKGK